MRQAHMQCLATAALLLAAGTTTSLAQTSTDGETTNPSSNTLTDSGQPDGANTNGGQRTSQPATPVQQAIADRASALGRSADSDRVNAITSFYADRDNQPAWLNDDGQPKPAVQGLIQAIQNVDKHGLSPDRYLTSPLSADGRVVDPAGSPDEIAARDVALSARFVALAHDLHFGVVDDSSVRVRWREPRAPVDYVQALRDATGGDPASTLADLGPQQPEYKALRQALARYRQIADNGGWPTVGEGPVLKEGMTDPRIATLWQRLQITGDAPENTPAPGKYNQQIMDAMRAYQKRNGLKIDGLLGPNTRDVLNVSVADRIDEIKLNMERWRWMPASFGDRYIAVNVPAFRLEAVDESGPDLSMDVIVGGSYDDQETPIFGDTMHYLVFRPYWNVPVSIARDEILPKQRKNPNYLAEKNYQIVDRFAPDAEPMSVTESNLNAVAEGQLFIRQAGGTSNALGLVKFIFPNEHAVYLHSTPADQLFDRRQRDLSHGCVRVADPVALADFALQDESQWTPQSIDTAMHSGGRERIDLGQSIPVYLLYWTAFVQDGTVNFRPDLYDHDAPVDTALKAAESPMT